MSSAPFSTSSFPVGTMLEALLVIPNRQAHGPPQINHSQTGHFLGSWAASILWLFLPSLDEQLKIKGNVFVSLYPSINFQNL
jgi:hypothetical protein